MDTPILDMLNGAASGARVRFCMPGHKGKAAFLSGDVDFLDLTEIPGTDNLYNPEGPILLSQRRYAASIGARHAFYLVNGSSCGLQAIMLSVLSPGDRIISARDVHVSTINAFILAGANPYFIKTRKPAGLLPNVVTPEDVEKAITVNPDAKAVLVTYPNYYGLCVDLETIAAMAHEAGMLMICDAAHGAAFDYSQQLPASPSECGCDLWVTSLHKTLPAMNQCAALLVGKGCHVSPAQIQSRINMVQTTSPSFLLLGSSEYATSLMDDEGPYLLSRTVDMVHDAIWRIGKLGGYKVVTAEVPYETGAYDRDILRMVIDVSDRGLTGIGAARDLHRRGVVIEGADLSNIILICTIADGKEDFEHLVRALQDIKGGIYSIEQSMTNVDVQNAITCEMAIPMREAAMGPKESVGLAESVGRVAAVCAGAFPPGVPLVLPGQEITRNTKSIFERLRRRGYGTFGFGDSIEVVKKKMRGLFLSVEGADGCGKSTQTRFLAEYLRDLGFDPLVTREPGGTRIAEELRNILLDKEHTEMAPSTEVLLYAAARAQHVEEVIKPALSQGRIVISDRFIDSSLAYQGAGRELGIDAVLAVNQYSVQGIMPDKTFFLDLPPELSFQRMNKRRADYDRLEDQDQTFYGRLYAGYMELLDRYKDRIIRIDASGSKYQTRDHIREYIDQILAERDTICRST